MGRLSRIGLIGAFVIFLLLVRFVAEIGVDRAPRERFRVVRIIDGDTFELTGGDRLRLIGIDCPEKGQPFYDSARAFAENMLLNRMVEISFSHRRRDGYGRLLGYVYCDSLFVNQEIIGNGLGYVYLFRDNLKDKVTTRQLLAAQEQAMEMNTAVWSIRYHPEPYYLAGRNSYRFHRPHCGSIDKTTPGKYITFKTRREAFRYGYSPCRNCRP